MLNVTEFPPPNLQRISDQTSGEGETLELDVNIPNEMTPTARSKACSVQSPSSMINSPSPALQIPEITVDNNISEYGEHRLNSSPTDNNSVRRHEITGQKLGVDITTYMNPSSLDNPSSPTIQIPEIINDNRSVISSVLKLRQSPLDDKKFKYPIIRVSKLMSVSKTNIH